MCDGDQSDRLLFPHGSDDSPRYDIQVVHRLAGSSIRNLGATGGLDSKRRHGSGVLGCGIVGIFETMDDERAEARKRRCESEPRRKPLLFTARCCWRFFCERSSEVGASGIRGLYRGRPIAHRAVGRREAGLVFRLESGQSSSDCQVGHHKARSGGRGSTFLHGPMKG